MIISRPRGISDAGLAADASGFANAIDVTDLTRAAVSIDDAITKLTLRKVRTRASGGLKQVVWELLTGNSLLFRVGLAGPSAVHARVGYLLEAPDTAVLGAFTAGYRAFTPAGDFLPVRGLALVPEATKGPSLEYGSTDAYFATGRGATVGDYGFAIIQGGAIIVNCWLANQPSSWVEGGFILADAFMDDDQRGSSVRFGYNSVVICRERAVHSRFGGIAKHADITLASEQLTAVRMDVAITIHLALAILMTTTLFKAVGCWLFVRLQHFTRHFLFEDDDAISIKGVFVASHLPVALLGATGIMTVGPWMDSDYVLDIAHVFVLALQVINGGINGGIHADTLHARVRLPFAARSILPFFGANRVGGLAEQNARKTGARRV